MTDKPSPDETIRTTVPDDLLTLIHRYFPPDSAEQWGNHKAIGKWMQADVPVPDDLLALIHRHFPLDLAEKWGRLYAIRRWVECQRWPTEGKKNHMEYQDRCQFLQMISDLHYEFPDLTGPELERHLSIKKVFGRRYKPSTYRRWRSEYMKNPEGRPWPTFKPTK